MADPEVPRKGRVLIADDDQTIVKLLSIYLESNGYEVIKASDGREALGLVQALEPDLAILAEKIKAESGGIPGHKLTAFIAQIARQNRPGNGYRTAASEHARPVEEHILIIRN